MDNFFESYNRAKSDVTNISNTLTSDETKIYDLRVSLGSLAARLDGIENAKVKSAAQNVHNTLFEALNRYATRLNVNKSRFAGIREITPQADRTMQLIQHRGTALAFNTGAVLALTAATAAVYGSVSALSGILDPVKHAIDMQADLLDMYIRKEITEAEYEKRAQALVTELETKNFFIQKEAGFNLPVVLIAGAGIYGTYKLLKYSGILEKILRVIK